MKKYIITILIGFLIVFSLSSCTDVEKVKNSNQSTTIELQEKAKQDTNVYKIVTVESNLYAINTKTNLVEYHIVESTNIVVFFFIVMILVLILLAVIL